MLAWNVNVLTWNTNALVCNANALTWNANVLAWNENARATVSATVILLLMVIALPSAKHGRQADVKNHDRGGVITRSCEIADAILHTRNTCRAVRSKCTNSALKVRHKHSEPRTL